MGGLMGVLAESGSGLQRKWTADRGVGVVAEAISEGKVAVRGVDSFSSLGLTAGMVSDERRSQGNKRRRRRRRQAWRTESGRSRARRSGAAGGGLLYGRRRGERGM